MTAMAQARPGPREQPAGDEVQPSWPRDYSVGRDQKRSRWFSRRKEALPPAPRNHVLPQRVGPKRRLLLERQTVQSAKRLAAYVLGLAILAFSLYRAGVLLSERGSDSGMVNTMLGIFTGIVVLFLVSHDSAVARKQGIDEKL